MSGILVVERSATLNHLLQRTLQASRVSSWAELTSYADTLDHLQRAADMGQPYGLIMLGAPARNTRDFEDLLMFLRSPRQAKIPLLLLAHEKTADIDAFVAARPETTFLLWANFSRIPAIIGQLAPAPEPAAVSETHSPDPTMSGTPMQSTSSSHKPDNGVRLLFVDDSASVRLAYKQLLDRNGYKTETAGSISEGYLKATSSHFDLMVIDYFLPDGNGDELCRKLRHNPSTASAAIAIITGTYREDVIKRCLEAGAVECTFKNEAKELFLARINGLARQVQMHKASQSEKQRLEGILSWGAWAISPGHRLHFRGQHAGVEMG